MSRLLYSSLSSQAKDALRVLIISKTHTWFHPFNRNPKTHCFLVQACNLHKSNISFFHMRNSITAQEEEIVIHVLKCVMHCHFCPLMNWYYKNIIDWVYLLLVISLTKLINTTHLIIILTNKRHSWWKNWQMKVTFEDCSSNLGELGDYNDIL